MARIDFFELEDRTSGEARLAGLLMEGVVAMPLVSETRHRPFFRSKPEASPSYFLGLEAAPALEAFIGFLDFSSTTSVRLRL